MGGAVEGEGVSIWGLSGAVEVWKGRLCRGAGQWWQMDERSGYFLFSRLNAEKARISRVL